MERPVIPIIYQDHHLLIVNKPAGMVVHPTYKHANATMWDSILTYLDAQGSDDWEPPQLPDEPGWDRAPAHIRQMLRERRLAHLWQEQGLMPRPVLLHRLDKDTSGVVALARTKLACRQIANQFREHTIIKRYLAVVCSGAPSWTHPRATFTVTDSENNAQTFSQPIDLLLQRDTPLLLRGPLQRDPDDRRRCIIGLDGQMASTRIRVLATHGAFLLVEAQPITGRTHQIRAHLAAAGYPLVGDPVYASVPEPGTPAAALPRQFLHAASLTIHDSHTHCPRTFLAPLSFDLTAWLRLYFRQGLEMVHQVSERAT